MPAKSKKQQMAAGAALAAKRGEKSKGSLQDVSKQMVESAKSSRGLKPRAAQNVAQPQTTIMKITYLVLLTYTDQGMRTIQQSPQRATAWRQQIEAAGITVLAQLWTAGACDGALILQGDDEQQILGALSQLAALGNVRTQSLRAFDAEEFAKIVGS